MSKALHILGDDFDSRAAIVVCTKTRKRKNNKNSRYYYYDSQSQECNFCNKLFILDMNITCEDVG